MPAENPRCWISQSAWWWPVEVCLDGDPGPDALETAILGLVGAGRNTSAAIAHDLCLPADLVGVAAAGLEGLGRLRREGDALVLGETTSVSPPLLALGWIAWDSRAGRPLLQLWLDPELPRSPPPCPRGATVAAWQADGEPPSRPSRGEVAKLVHLFPNLPSLVVLRPLGAGVERMDEARATRVRLLLGSPRLLAIWSPVEVRVSGLVVWRPMLLPSEYISTELDPGGADALAHSNADGRALVETARTRVLSDIAPGVLEAAGFADTEALEQSARRTTERDLGALAHIEFRALFNAVEQAYRQDKLAVPLRLDAHAQGRLWVPVLEEVGAELARWALPTLRELQASPPPPSRSEWDRFQKLFGRTWGQAAAVIQAADVSQLKQSWEADRDTLGQRIVAVAIVAVANAQVRQKIQDLCAHTPDFFDELSAARDTRNTLSHAQRGEPVPVDAPEIRARALKLARAITKPV